MGPRRLEESYQAFKDLASLKVDSFLEEWKGQNHSVEDYEDIISKYLEVKTEFLNLALFVKHAKKISE